MNGTFDIRHARDSDLDAITAMSNKESQWVGTADRPFFEKYISLPEFLVAKATNGAIAGFVLGMTPEVDYDSLNFIWFRDRFNPFLYIDRVVVAPEYRRQGLATEFYNRLKQAEKGPLVCEVCVKNDESIAFHERFGFTNIGQFSSKPPKVCTMYKLV